MVALEVAINRTAYVHFDWAGFTITIALAHLGWAARTATVDKGAGTLDTFRVTELSPIIGNLEECLGSGPVAT